MVTRHLWRGARDAKLTYRVEFTNSLMARRTAVTDYSCICINNPSNRNGAAKNKRYLAAWFYPRVSSRRIARCGSRGANGRRFGILPGFAGVGGAVQRIRNWGFHQAMLYLNRYIIQLRLRPGLIGPKSGYIGVSGPVESGAGAGPLRFTHYGLLITYYGLRITHQASRFHSTVGRVFLTLGRVKLLFIGDIVGEPGRRAVKQLVPRLRQQHELDMVIANGENSAGGSGITPNTAEEIFSAGVDLITSGVHLWDQKEVMALLENEKRFLRPLNYPPGAPGRGSAIVQLSGKPPLAVFNLQGRTFMPVLENPFLLARAEVERLRQITKIIFVDLHAEATSEKISLARMLDGLVSAVVGTHTHVQTADEQIFPGGTAFLCDAGFTGPHESVLGREIEPVIKRFLTSQPQRFEVAKERVLLQGALIEVDENTGCALSVQRISEPLST